MVFSELARVGRVLAEEIIRIFTHDSGIRAKEGARRVCVVGAKCESGVIEWGTREALGLGLGRGMGSVVVVVVVMMMPVPIILLLCSVHSREQETDKAHEKHRKSDASHDGDVEGTK